MEQLKSLLVLTEESIGDISENIFQWPYLSSKSHLVGLFTRLKSTWKKYQILDKSPKVNTSQEGIIGAWSLGKWRGPPETLEG